MFQEEKECYVSELRVQLTTKNKWINLWIKRNTNDVSNKCKYQM